MLDKYIQQIEALSLNQKLALLLMLFGLTFAYGYYEFIEPTQNSLEEVKKTEILLDQQIEEATKIGRTLPELEKARALAQEKLAVVFDIIPKTVEVDEILASFTKASEKSGVELSNFKPVSRVASNIPINNNLGAPQEKVQPLENIKKKIFEVEAKGNFAEIMLFVDQVLGLPRVIRLESFSFKGENGPDVVLSSKTSKTLNSKLSFAAFFQSGGVDLSAQLLQNKAPINAIPLEDMSEKTPFTEPVTTEGP